MWNHVHRLFAAPAARLEQFLFDPDSPGGDRYGVDAGAGEFLATLAGRYRHEHEGEALPTAGDWVLLATDDPVISIYSTLPQTMICLVVATARRENLSMILSPKIPQPHLTRCSA